MSDFECLSVGDRRLIIDSLHSYLLDMEFYKHERIICGISFDDIDFRIDAANDLLTRLASSAE